jgi:lipopolysaccharide export system protein LptA
MELTGNPHWQEGLREGTGKVFVFDRAHNTLRAEGDAYWKLPRESVSQSGLTLFSQSNGETNAAATTGTNFVEIYADAISLQLPPTNGPVQSVTAEKRVVIVDRLKNSRATGGRAYYAESSGILELTENALWQADQRIAKGDALIFDRNNKTFSARTNAYMKFPVAALGRSSPLGDTTAGSVSATTNQFIEVAANTYDYQGDRLTFRDQVQAGFAEGEVIRGTLECATLKVGFSSNQLQTIEAKTDVYARQLPIMDVRGRTVEKELKCEQLNVRMRTNGLVEEIVAERNVMTSQTETRTNRPLPVRLTLNSETMTAKFLTYTNQVETVVADRQVVITSAEKTAHGEKAVYTGTNDIAELSGHPMLEGTNFTMTAETIVLDHGKGKYYGRKNVKITTELHAGNMSKTNLFGKPKVKAP